MNSDCTVKIDDGFINLRVGAIIPKNGKMLMAEDGVHDYYYSIGGRIKFGENAEEAVIREIYEETGVKMEIDRLGYIHENYFLGDCDINRGKLIYEISFYFYMKVPEDFEPIQQNSSKSCDKLVWTELDDSVKFYPEFFRDALSSPSYAIRHIVSDNRIKNYKDEYKILGFHGF